MIGIHTRGATLATSSVYRGLLREVAIVTPLLDRLRHKSSALKFFGKSWRLEGSATHLAKGR